jgi:integrase
VTSDREHQTMTKHNAKNERIKHHYLSYLQEAKRYSESTIDAVAKALGRFEIYTKRRDFKKFRFQQAIGFKRYLGQQKNQKTSKPLSKSTLHSTMGQLRNFFHWLAGQPGYKSQLQYSDAEYFNISDKEMRIATARREQKAPTLEQVKHVISNMPRDTEIERRNRALVAFTLLTAARDSAIASIKLKHVDLSAGCVHQDAREVQTKYSKTFPTFFFPVGVEIVEIVSDWVNYLREEKFWGNDDPLFPATRTEHNEKRRFQPVGVDRKHWSSAAAIREIFKKAFVAAGLPYFNPHSFRNTLVRLGETVCKSPEHLKAWSQNLGHEKVLTTLLNYGQVETQRQGEIIKGLALENSTEKEDLRKMVFEAVREANQRSVE